MQLSQLMRLWYLSHRQPAKAQASLHIQAVSPELLLFAHMKYGSRRRVRPKIWHLAPLDGCACAFEQWVYGGRNVSNSHELAKFFFFQLDSQASGYVDWNEFCTYLLLLYRENDYMRTKREIPFLEEPKIRHIVQNRVGTDVLLGRHWQNQQIGLCAQRRLRSAWASAQSDQSLRCPHEESLGP